MYDVCIIGAGVCGCAVARELSRYQASVCVVEKCEDVCCGTSKANSAIVHAGFDAPPGSLRARLNVEGNARMEQLAKERDVPFQRNGSLVVCLQKEDLPRLQELYEKGVKNGVPGLKILSREEAVHKEPNLSDDVAGALYAPTGGIVCPFLLTIALAENACTNGVEFLFDTTVTQIQKGDGFFTIQTDQGALQSRYIVNAAGVYADQIYHMAGSLPMKITARKGEYLLLDHSAGGHVSHTVFMLPTKMGKGVLVSPTVHGNLLVGPTAADLEDKEGTNTTRQGLAELRTKAQLAVKGLPFSPAVGVMVAELLREKMGLAEKADFTAQRKGIVRPSDLSLEERNALIREQPAYGTVVCRCESVTEGEIIDAIHRPVGARSLDGIKRRTRAGMGRCQSGFCSPRVMEILERELGMQMEKITKSGGHSAIVAGQTKG